MFILNLTDTYISFSDVLRSCYQGELDVDPYKLGCHLHADDNYYCFCADHYCNSSPIPVYPKHSPLHYSDQYSETSYTKYSYPKLQYNYSTN